MQPALAAILALSVLFAAAPARADVFACLDKKGGVVCHVTGQPEVAAALCNASCPACKNACAAKRLVSEGGQGHGVYRPDPNADTSPNTIVPGADNGETARKIIEDGLVQTPK